MSIYAQTKNTQLAVFSTDPFPFPQCSCLILPLWHRPQMRQGREWSGLASPSNNTGGGGGVDLASPSNNTGEGGADWGKIFRKLFSCNSRCKCMIGFLYSKICRSRKRKVCLRIVAYWVTVPPLSYLKQRSVYQEVLCLLRDGPLEKWWGEVGKNTKKNSCKGKCQEKNWCKEEGKKKIRAEGSSNCDFSTRSKKNSRRGVHLKKNSCTSSERK